MGTSTTESGTEKKCPDCAELVRADARICRFCRFDFRTNVSGDGVSRDEPPAEAAPRTFAMEMAWSQLESGHTKLALDQAFSALQEAHHPSQLSDLASFASTVRERNRSGRHRMRADVLATRVEQTTGGGTNAPRRPPPSVKGQVRQMGPAVLGGSAQSIMQPDGSLRCVRCGGTQFEARRSTGMKLGWGAASLLASPNEVHCVACGAKYPRR